MDTVLWPYNSATQTHVIPVCWQTSGEFLNKFYVQQAVENAWESVSLVDFTGWGDCSNLAFSGIRITINNTLPPRAALGTQGRSRVGVMRLDFRMNTLSKSISDLNYPNSPAQTIFARCQNETPGSTLISCLQSQAIHEFGHILGLAHEQNRPTGYRNEIPTRGECTNRDLNPTFLLDQATSFETWGNTLFTDYDPNSIMNYCRYPYFGRTDLSTLDKLAVRAYYGRIPTYDSRTGVFTIPRIRRLSDNAILTGSFQFIGGAGQGVFQRIGSFQPTTTPSKATATLDASGVLRMPEERSINTAGHVCIIASVTLVPISPGLYQNNYSVIQPTQFVPNCS